jgi:hypothetical protein
MRSKRLILVAGLTAAATTLSGLVGVQPAAAAGWIGDCYANRGTFSAGGWCDGNGPDWTYQAVVTCTNGGQYWGVRRWAGDRRGSYAECPAGTTTSGGLYYYYQNSQKGFVGA